jgi:WD repeat-containing protein 23
LESDCARSGWYVFFSLDFVVAFFPLTCWVGVLTVHVLTATSWNGWGMATGTVSLHSWNDGAEDDEALPAMSSNYNARLDMREDFDVAARRARAAGENKSRSRAEGRGLRSSVVRPQRLGLDDEDEGAGGGGIW